MSYLDIHVILILRVYEMLDRYVVELHRVASVPGYHVRLNRMRHTTICYKGFETHST